MGYGDTEIEDIIIIISKIRLLTDIKIILGRYSCITASITIINTINRIIIPNFYILKQHPLFLNNKI